MQDSSQRFASGERVTFRAGVFSGFDAAVVEVDPAQGIVEVAIAVFGKETVVRLPFDEAARVLQRADSPS